MNDRMKEQYKKAFSVLHAPDDNLYQEVLFMAKLKKKQKRTAAAAAVAACLLIGGGTSAYAANIGGIQRTVQLWIHGDQTTATLDIDVTNNTTESSYRVQYSDPDGTSQEITGGGVAMDSNGTKRALTEQEILDQLNTPDVEYEEDGTVWLYYKDRKLDITDKFDKDQICYTKIDDGEDTLYLTIKYQNGFSCSSDKYPDPASFN